MASCRKWILNIHSFTIWIKNEQLPVDHTFWWPILRKKFHEIFTLVWEAISKTRASGFIRRSKHLETIKALGRSGLVLSSVSRCLEPLIKPSHSLLIYYFKLRLKRETNLMQACSANRHQVIMPSWLPKVPSWLRKNALCLSQSAFSNFALHVIKMVKNIVLNSSQSNNWKTNERFFTYSV